MIAGGVWADNKPKACVVEPDRGVRQMVWRMEAGRRMRGDIFDVVWFVYRVVDSGIGL